MAWIYLYNLPSLQEHINEGIVMNKKKREREKKEVGRKRKKKEKTLQWPKPRMYINAR